MSKTNTIIELNGKRYNATTGELLGHTGHVKHAAAAGSHHRKTIDGVMKAAASKPAKAVAPTAAHAPAHHQAAPAAQPAKQPVRIISDVHRTTQHTTRHKPQRSQTLVRHSVKQPGPSLKRTVKAHTPRTDVLAKVPHYEIAAKLSVRHVDTKRLQRAERIAKNQLVSRFGHVEVVKSAHHGAAHHAAGTRHPLPAIQGVSVSNEDLQAVQPVYADSAAANSHASLDIFEQALARASSHKESYVSPKTGHRRAKKHQRSFAKRLASTSAVALTCLLLIGFIAYQNTANIQMRVASAKAGFHASLPGYRPPGFHASSFNYSPGTVAVNFISNSDSRAYNITQKASNWNSETLLDEYVSNAAGDSYRTLDAGGRTIYTYGDNNATWVDHGVWYNVKTDGGLSTSQLVNLATSM
jgi:hypothetical protein